MAAKLYVVATPIGNLNDLTPRMSEALSECDLIAAEDTRVTMKLTEKLSIKKPMVSCHRHNEDARANGLIERMLKEELTVCITCDAGTPGISDPGQALVKAAWEAGVPVIPICGPSAAVTALSASGFEATEFAFYGFLPRENKQLNEKLTEILKTGIPVAVMYESPHRVVSLVEHMAEIWPGAVVAVCCDLTKKYEKILRGTPEEVLADMKNNPNVEKGEYCITADLRLVEAPKEPERALKTEHLILDYLMEGYSLRESADMVMKSGRPRNEVYKARLNIDRLLNGED
ncbi:MAG: 16S rRNA (cytidine(1402)-2'-O)-methyltransferase [Clostridia bacterium]|nr:16S rRNA (cytidine(1402)-2'-O)-methyltransferase [Clostridia bacterium]